MRNLFRRIGSVMLALCLLLTALPTTVLAENSDYEEGAIEYTASGYSGTYDGQPHSITVNVATQNVNVRYAYPAGTAYSTTNPTFTAPGSYTVGFMIDGPGYPAVEDFATVTITEAKISYSVSDSSVPYDGQPHSINLKVTTQGMTVLYVDPETKAYTETKPTFTEIGTYTVPFLLKKEGYTSEEGSATLTITEGIIPYTIGFDGTNQRSVGYDGTAHVVCANIDIADVDVRYSLSSEGPYSVEAPSFTDAGSHTVWFKLEKQKYKTVEESVTVEIIPADVSSQVKLSAKEFYTYTGEPVVFNPVCAGIDSWTYTYYQGETPLDAAPTAVGSYRVEITGEGANSYAEIEHSYSILAAEIVYTAEDYTGTYDGQPHSITVIAKIEGATVTYTASLDEPYTETNPAFTDAGEYPVWFKIEKDNYANVGGCVWVKIAKADATNQVSFDRQDSYAYTGSPVAFNPVCAGIDTWTFTYYQGETQLDAAPSASGSYRVEISGEGTNHTAQLSHSYSIIDTKISYSVSGYSGYYDGKAHSITVRVATEGARVTFAESENGAYSAANPSYTEPGEYTVYFKIEKEGYETVVDSASVTITELGTIKYSVIDYRGYYDGKAHSITLRVATEGVTVTYNTPENTAYTTENPAYTEFGMYLVGFKLKKEGYETVTGVAKVIIFSLSRIEYSVQDYSGYYDGKAHTINLNVTTTGVSATYATSEGGAYSADMPSFTDIGTYTVWFKLEKVNHKTVIGSASVTIIGEIKYSVSDYRGYYDGAAHSITLRVATEGVTVTYNTPENTAYTTENPAYTEFGVYLVGFRLNKEGYETVTGVAKVIIANLRQIEYSVEGYSGDYDGKAHTINLNVTTAGVSATYATSEGGAYSAALPSFTEPDAYTVWFKLEKEGYKTVAGSATVTIAALGKIKYTVDDYIGTYDGQPHTISLNVLTEGVDVTYSVNFIESKTLPTFTEPGSHTIHVKLEKKGYITAYDTSCVTIDPGVIEYSARGYSGYADGKAHSIQLYVSTPDAKVSYATSKGGKYSATKPSFSEVSTHTVWYRIEKEHYTTVEGFEVVKLRQPKEDSIVYSVEDYVGAYDGEAHTIALDVTTPNVNVAYATSRDGEYGATLPSFTEPGTHTVWFRLKKSGYETSTGSATVTIEKAEQVLYFIYNVYPARPIQNHAYYMYYTGLKHDRGDGALSWTCSDPDRVRLEGDIVDGTLIFDVPYEEWREGYSATITVTAAETDHYKAATATCTIVASDNIKAEYSSDSGSGSAADVMHYKSKHQVTIQMQETIQMQDIDLTVSPVSTLDNQSLLSASDELRKKLMASAGAGQIGSMAVDAALIDTHTGEELHSTNGDLTLTLTGDLQRKYQENYKEMDCIAVHLKQDSTAPAPTDSTAPAEQDVSYNPDTTSTSTGDSTVESYDFTMPTGGVTADSSFAPMPDSTYIPRTDVFSVSTGDQSVNSSNPAGEWTIQSNDFTMSTYGATADSSSAPTTDSTYLPRTDVFSVSTGDQSVNSSNPAGEWTIQSNDFTMSTYGATADSSSAPTTDSTPAPQDTSMGGAGASAGSSGFTMDGGTIDNSSDANEAGAGVYNNSSSFTMDGGTIDTSATGNGNSNLIGNTGNGIGGGNSGEGSNIQISGGSVSAADNTGNGIGGGSSGEGSNIQISGGSVKSNAATSAPRPNDSGEDPTGTQVYKTEVNLDGNNSSGANPNGSTNQIPGSLSLDDSDNSNEGQLLVQRDNQTIVPTGSLSPTVEYIPCELTENGVVVSDTSLSPFLLIYGPKEAFSKLLTVRAKDGMFIYDGEGHAVAAEPSIAEGTTLYYSLDLENWQTEAPAFTDVLWNEDGSVGSYQVYVLADNPDCDPAVCSYTATILPAA